MTETFSAGPIENRDDYFRLFDNAQDEKAIGEASICYLWSETAPANIAREFPDAKILLLLRDPADRAFSQFLHMLSFADRPISFREYITSGLESQTQQWSELYPFLKFGFYQEQLTRYLGLFPRERLRIHFYEDYQRDPLGVLQDYFAFLGVNPGFSPDFTKRHMQAQVPRSWGLHRVLKPLSQWGPVKQVWAPGFKQAVKRVVFQPREALRMAPEDRALLVDLYRDDIQALEGMLGRDLSAWYR
jgi:hypothetical protein